jgi:homoserine kinase
VSRGKIAVIAPATLSNMGPGFDVFGIALREPYDIIEAKKTEEEGVVIEGVEGRGSETITKEADKNSASLAAQAVLTLSLIHI